MFINLLFVKNLNIHPYEPVTIPIMHIVTMATHIHILNMDSNTCHVLFIFSTLDKHHKYLTYTHIHGSQGKVSVLRTKLYKLCHDICTLQVVLT